MRDFGFLRFSLLLFCAHFTICRISAGLLSAAQFVKKNAFTPVYCCYTKHNFKNLFSGVVICGTFYEKLYFSIPCCYGQHSFSVCRVRLLSAAQFRSAGFFLPGLLNAAHFFAERLFHIRIVTESTIQKILFCGCYTWHFSKIPPKIATAAFLRKKYFFALLPPAHCSAAHSPVVRQRTAELESTAQFCCNFRHSYTLFLNIYKYSLKFPKTKNAYFRRGKRNVLNVTIIDTRRTIWYYTLNELRDTFREIRMLF